MSRDDSSRQPVRGVSERNIRLVVEYDGSGFQGFQRQPGLRTVQSELEKAIAALTGYAGAVIAAGRTDAGVHAAGQVANFHTRSVVPTHRMMYALNRALPGDVAVLKVDEVPERFHSRYDAVSRTYRYTVLNRTTPSALTWRCAWHVRHPLSLSAMLDGAELLLGRHDFGAFGTAEKGRSSMRDVVGLDLERHGDMLYVTCKANAFLQHMARGIVGALCDLGTRRRNMGSIQLALADPDQSPGFTVAPPNGLCLMEVSYAGIPERISQEDESVVTE